MSFDYAAFTTRNIGFVTEAEQEALRAATVFVCGTGGMGGACVLALARMGVGRLILADIDAFEVSNMNRQVFAQASTIGRHKAEASAEICRTINPDLDITVHRTDWPDHARAAVERAAIVVNGTDDLGASLLLYRTARTVGRTMVDAYAAPLPSIYVTRSRRPDARGTPRLPDHRHRLARYHERPARRALLCELEHVVLHSSARHHIDLDLAGEVAAGRRSRMSFAPMVITTGMLMAYEVANGILGRPHGADCRGWFLNPYAGRVERPRGALATALMRPLVRRFLRRMTA
jgi:molybdopterin-synthase adenylyltransferase